MKYVNKKQDRTAQKFPHFYNAYDIKIDILTTVDLSDLFDTPFKLDSILILSEIFYDLNLIYTPNLAQSHMPTAIWPNAF